MNQSVSLEPQQSSELKSNTLEHNPSIYNLEKGQMSQSDLDQSFDQLLPGENDSKNELYKSYLQDSKNPTPKKEEGSSLEEKPKNMFWRGMTRIQKLLKKFQQINSEKSVPHLSGEVFLFGFLSYTMSWMKFKNQAKINNENKQLQFVKERVNSIRTNSATMMKDSIEGQNVLVYGYVQQQNTEYFQNLNYRMYNLVVNHNNIPTNKYEFPIQKNQQINNKAFVLLDNKLVKNTLVAFGLGKTIEISLDSSNLNIGEGVYILGKKLANSSIMPQAIFRSLNFSKVEKYIKSLESKNTLFKFLGASFFAIAMYQIYNILKKSADKKINIKISDKIYINIEDVKQQKPNIRKQI